MGVSCGTNHTAAFTKDGQLYCWGWGEHGRLGLGDEVGAMYIHNSQTMMFDLGVCNGRHRLLPGAFHEYSRRSVTNRTSAGGYACPGEPLAALAGGWCSGEPPRDRRELRRRPHRGHDGGRDRVCLRVE